MASGSFSSRLRAGDGPRWAKAKKFVRAALRFNIPTIKAIHLPLFHLRSLVLWLLRHVVATLWTIPLFKARCESAGRQLSLPNGIPFISCNLRLRVGDNVTLYRSSLEAAAVVSAPQLSIGDSVIVGYGTTISVGERVTIGDNTIIASNCFIADNDGHSVSPVRRERHLPVRRADIRPVTIGSNVWIGHHCTILRGVTIGDNAVVAAHSLVVRSIPPNSLVGGTPAGILLRDIRRWPQDD